MLANDISTYFPLNEALFYIHSYEPIGLIFLVCIFFITGNFKGTYIEYFHWRSGGYFASNELGLGGCISLGFVMQGFLYFNF